MQRIVSLKIGREEAGTTLLELLVARFTYHDRNGWIEQLDAGRLQINCWRGYADTVLKCGDYLEYKIPEVAEPEVDTDFSVIFEDEHLLVIDKPADLPCHPSGKYFRNTLWALVRERFRLDPVRIVHRLDRETSGLVMVAKTEQAARGCQQQLQNRAIDKVYLALVEGEFPEKLEAIGKMGPDPESVVRKKQRFYGDGEPLPAGVEERMLETASTSFKLERAGHGFSLVRAIPHTGRLHQIRATLLNLGFPIVGDKLYGVDEGFFVKFINDELTGDDWERLRLSRQGLHAWRLTFSHPVNGRRLSLTAPIPPEFLRLLEHGRA
jgi:23S rRNA pseudouridine955/2504/2580 synthase/23S rRNA pseudouridine1911/1915/1917 synthase